MISSFEKRTKRTPSHKIEDQQTTNFCSCIQTYNFNKTKTYGKQNTPYSTCGSRKNNQGKLIEKNRNWTNPHGDFSEYLEEETSKVGAHIIYLVSSKLVLPFPHCFLLLHIFLKTHSHLKHLLSRKNHKWIHIFLAESKTCTRIIGWDLQREPCIQCRYLWLEPRTGRNVAKDATGMTASLSCCWSLVEIAWCVPAALTCLCDSDTNEVRLYIYGIWCVVVLCVVKVWLRNQTTGIYSSC